MMYFLDAKQYPVVSPVKKAPVVNSSPSVVRDHRSQSPKLMEVLNSIDVAREFVGNVAAVRNQQQNQAGIAAARRMQTNASPVRGDAKRSQLVEYEDQEEVRNVRALSQPEDKQYKRDRGDSGDERRRLDDDDDALEATVNNNHQPRGGIAIEDDLDASLATWLLEQKRSVTMRKKPMANSSDGATDSEMATHRREKTYMSVDAAAETVRDDDQVAFYSSQQRPRQRRPSGGEAYDDELFEEYGNMTIEDATMAAYGRGKIGGDIAVSVSAAVDDMHGSYDMHRPLRAKFANGEDADVIGMQCMLAQALIDDDLNNGSKYDDDDDA